MPYEHYLEQVQSKYPYTYEASHDNNDAYLREERCEDSYDHFSDNDF